ncbi:MAG: hypothetical protein DWQ37_18675 [Planctomycetota bacterium]|nr:MAG: hypothetical protein DWQ37_18675 [Planctomycetota bacterium]
MRIAFIYLLFALGGVAALTYEVVWMRSCRTVFGSSTHSAAAVVAAFFGGMALGNWIGSRLARSGRPIRRYGLTEIWIGATALFVGPWLGLFHEAYPTLYPHLAADPLVGTAAKFMLALCALLPPTAGIGVTLPLVVRAVVRQPDRLARTTGQLYALNVLGAASGAALAGFVLPMWIGVSGGVYLAAALNLFVGLAALAYSLLSAEQPVQLPSAVEEQVPLRKARWRPLAWVLTLTAILSGFGTLALEVLYFRILSFRTDGSVYSFSLMLIIFLVCLALGAFVVARFGDRTNLWRLLAVTQTAAMVGIFATPVLFDIGLGIASIGEVNTLGGQVARIALVAAPTMGLTVLLAGIVLPAVWKLAVRQPEAMGQSVGKLAAWNTLAGVAGSLLAGFLLLPRLGLGPSLLVVGALYGVVALVGFAQGFRGVPRWVGGTACLALFAAWYGGGVWKLIDRPNLASGETLLRYRNGAAATVAVVEHRGGHRTMRMNHTYTLGSSAAAARELRQGRLPLVLHGNPRSVAFIGVATGITASAALDFQVERAVAIELVPEVADALEDFARWNRSVADSPRVEVVVDDGRNFLLGTNEQFDVIVSDLFVPWHAGSGDLYSVEHFRAVAERLAPGGLFAQWLPGYQLTVEEIRSIVASLREAFASVTLWRCDFDARQPLLCLVCTPDRAASSDGRAIVGASRLLAEGKGPRAPFLSSVEGVAMLYVAGDRELAEWAEGAPLNSDDFPFIEYSTPGSYLRHRQRDLEPLNRWLADFRPRSWRFFARPLPDESLETSLSAADLLHDAQVARGKNHFESEFRSLIQLAQLAGDVPAVVDHTISAAMRYRSRQMMDRSEQLLETLTDRANPPAAALIALAGIREQDGRLPEAVDCLSRAIDEAPESTAIRESLVELLKQQEQYDLLEAHLQYLLDRNPDEPYRRLDLAQAFDRQGKLDQAREQIEQFRNLQLGNERRKAWQYLRGLQLGKYVDEYPDSDLSGSGVSSAESDKPGAEDP